MVISGSGVGVGGATGAALGKECERGRAVTRRRDVVHRIVNWMVSLNLKPDRQVPVP